MYKPPRLNQEDINNLNRSLMSKDIETANFPKERSLGLDGFTAEF
jgi:hypothetical protein